MEAEKTMFTPLNKKVKKMIAEGAIGKLHTIRAQYCSDGLEGLPEDHWVLGEEFGGCTYDIGVYPICASHFYADAQMKEFQAEVVRNPEYNCDFGMDADIFYENGIYGCVRANWFYQAKDKGKAVLVGDKGYFEIPAYWKGNKAYLHKDGIVTEIEVYDYNKVVQESDDYLDNNKEISYSHFYDDGKSFDYREGIYTLYNITVSNNEINIDPVVNNYKLYNKIMHVETYSIEEIPEYSGRIFEEIRGN